MTCKQAFARFMALAHPWVDEGSPEWMRNWWPFKAGWEARETVDATDTGA